jgi:hypothetical protein
VKLIFGPLERPLLRGSLPMNVGRPSSNVQAERLKDGGRFLSAFPTAGQQALFGKGLREHAKKHLTSNGGGRSAAGAR